MKNVREVIEQLEILEVTLERLTRIAKEEQRMAWEHDLGYAAVRIRDIVSELQNIVTEQQRQHPLTKKWLEEAEHSRKESTYYQLGGPDPDIETEHIKKNIVPHILEKCTAELEAHESESSKLLQRCETALIDWTCSFASEHCDEERVKEARERMDRDGTLYYIGSLVSDIRKHQGNNKNE